MKKAIIIVSIITVVSLLCVIGFAVAAAATGIPVILNNIPGHIGNIKIGDFISDNFNHTAVEWDYNWDDFVAEESQTKTLDLSQIDTVDISVDAAKLEIVKTQGTTAEILLETSKAAWNHRTFKAEASGSTASIDVSYRDNVNLDLKGIAHTKVTIRLPEKNYKKLKLNLNAGDFSMDSINCDETEVDLNAGNVEINNVSGKKLNITNNAGNAEIHEGCRFTDEIIAKVNAGNISLNIPKDSGFLIKYDCNMGTVMNHLSVDAEEDSDRGEFISKSGTIKYKDESCKIRLSADVGNIDIY